MIYSKTLSLKFSSVPYIGRRQLLVHSLVESYNLHEFIHLISPKPATKDELLAFHSRDYVELLKNANGEEDMNEEMMDEVGLGYDCPVMDKMIDWCLTVAGGSLSAAEHLMANDHVRTVINWEGGWHHAHRDSAAGFCYVNDIVLAIHRLQSKYKRILYIDLDVHHGDGVEEAFSATDRVVTWSIHKYEPGYFPGTGNATDIGTGKGRYHSINVPLMEGVTNSMYRKIFTSILPHLMTAYGPECVVAQCGADCLVGDNLGGFNMTPEALAECVRDILSHNLPVLILGGGGYNHINTAKCWTAITAAVVGETLDDDIPEDEEYFEDYGPDFQLTISPGCVRNRNTEVQIDNLISYVKDNISNIT